jgi:hypothetical protein
MKMMNMGEKNEVGKGEERVIRCKVAMIEPDLVRLSCW